MLCQVLSGLGGVGKTQLAAAHARQLWQAGEFDLWTGYPPPAAAPSWPATPRPREEVVTLVVQVAGKVRDRLCVPAGIDESAATERALASETVQRALGGSGQRPRRVVYLPDKLINLVP